MEIEYKTITTKEDYLKRKGVNLDIELKGLVAYDLGDNPAPCFIYDLEQQIIDKLTTEYSWDGTFKNEHQKECFKNGIIQQIEYIIQVGSQRSQKSTRDELLATQLYYYAEASFRRGGMMNYMRY